MVNFYRIAPRSLLFAAATVLFSTSGAVAEAAKAPASCSDLRDFRLTYESVRSAFGGDPLAWTDADRTVARSFISSCAREIPSLATYNPDFVYIYVDELFAQIEADRDALTVEAEIHPQLPGLRAEIGEMYGFAQRGELRPEQIARLDEIADDLRSASFLDAEVSGVREDAITVSETDERVKATRTQDAADTAERARREAEWEAAAAERERELANAPISAEVAAGLYFFYLGADACSDSGTVWTPEMVPQLAEFLASMLADRISDDDKSRAWSAASAQFQTYQSRVTVDDCEYAHSYFTSMGFRNSVAAGERPF